MDDFLQKALWVALPLAIAALVTLVPGPATEVRAIAYGVLALAAAGGLWVGAWRRRGEERDAEERERWDKLNRRLDMGDRADRVLLRNELVRMHREWVEVEGEITLEALEYAENTFSTYHELGGNGSGTKLWEDIRALPVRR